MSNGFGVHRALILFNREWYKRSFHNSNPELARVTNSARLFTPGEKDSIADSKVGVIV